MKKLIIVILWISAAIIDSLCLKVGIKEPVKSTAHAILNQNSPNTFRDQTTISFELFASVTISVEIMNNMGISVKSVLIKQQDPTGEDAIKFDGTNLQPGVYFCV